MMKRAAALILLSSLSANALAIHPFVVSDIRIEGLQRIAAGTVFSYLPVRKGDTITDNSAQQAIRALYRTGFFKNVELEQQQDILVVKVNERPSIAKLDVRGNRAIKKKDLMKGLKSIGLYEGSTFERLALDQVKKELVSQYYNQGKYNVSIEPHVTHLDNNRVAIDIDIKEGKTARIKGINIVGNSIYDDKKIRRDFESNTTNWKSWFNKDDQYSREKLSGDLEKLGAYYMDRGYADFDIDSTQVAITPDKQKMYITASVDEGEKYTISEVDVVGDLVLPEETIRHSIYIDKGDTFNRARIQRSAQSIKNILADIGYVFAEVNPEPQLNKEDHTVRLRFDINPGKRVYVNRITFSGNTRTEDEVLRREMRQMEGAWYSQAAIDRSKTRLDQLGYFKNVQINQRPVPGTDDQVDLIVNMEEQQAGSLQFGIGYSQYSKAILSASVSQRNLLGTGDQFSLGVQTSKYYESLNINYVNPYITDNGVSMGYDLNFSKTNFDDSDFANYRNKLKSFSTYLGFPISETDNVTIGGGIETNKITLFPKYSPASYIAYQEALGHKSTTSYLFSTSYTHETRNSYWAPTRGGLQSLSLDIAVPGSTVRYFKLGWRGSHYWPIGRGFVLNLNGKVDYGDVYGHQKYKRNYVDPDTGKVVHNAGDTVDFPFWENYFAGGVDDVRGFQDNSLGPREKTDYYYDNTPIGGAFKVYGSAQVFVPLSFLKDIQTARVALFTDVGNVYKDYKSFSKDKLRASAGAALQWQSPIGPLILSYAIPIRKRSGDDRYTERFQFTFGTNF